jgi:hypothetical protein
VDSARKAIIASLHQGQGGEGGIFIDVGGESFRISVETKKEKGDRPAGRGRGVGGGAQGAGNGGPERGSFRGRGTGRTGGRGGGGGGGGSGPK